MRRNLELFEALQPRLLALMQLREWWIYDGNEAYGAAGEIYRDANGSVAGLDNLIEEMGQRFAQQSSRSRGQAVEVESAS